MSFSETVGAWVLSSNLSRSMFPSAALKPLYLLKLFCFLNPPTFPIPPKSNSHLPSIDKILKYVCLLEREVTQNEPLTTLAVQNFRVSISDSKLTKWENKRQWQLFKGKNIIKIYISEEICIQPDNKGTDPLTTLEEIRISFQMHLLEVLYLAPLQAPSWEQTYYVSVTISWKFYQSQ